MTSVCCTLTGAGGTGKTRLAVQAAAEAAEPSPDGVFWVPLAPLRDPALVLATVAEVMELRSKRDSHSPSHSLRHSPAKPCCSCSTTPSSCCRRSPATWRRSLRRPETDFRRDEPRAAADCGRARLPGADPRRRGRRRLFSRSRPCRRSDLLVERSGARALRNGSTTCRSRSSSPPPARGSSRPSSSSSGSGSDSTCSKGERDADPRQQTLRATIAWSHDLLSTEEQQAFARYERIRGRLHARGRRGDLRERSRHAAVAPRQEPHSPS